MKKPEKQKGTPKPPRKGTPEKPKTTPRIFPDEIEQKLIAARAFWIGEKGLLKESWEKKREALVLAFEIGKIIHDIPKQYNKRAVKTLADEWHCSEQTVYNYDHLYCGCLFESNIKNFPEITREYFQALGSSIRWVDDFFGYAVHLHILLNPAYKPPSKFGKRKVDPDRVLDIGKLVKDTRQVAIDDLKAEHLLGSWRREPSNKDGGISFVFPADETNSEKGVELRKLCGLLLHEVGLMVGNKVEPVKFKDFEDIKDDIFGSDDPKANYKGLTAKLLIHIREKRRRQKRQTSNTPLLLDESVKARVHCGESEEVLLDRSRFPERSVDVVITDPPYSEEYYKAWRRLSAIDHYAKKTIAEQAEVIFQVAKLIVEKRIARESFMWFSFCPIDVVHRFLPPLLQAFQKVPHISQVLVWDKMELVKVGGHQMFAKQQEAILYINCGDRALATTTDANGKKRNLHSPLMQYRVTRKDSENPSWKPPALLRKLVTLATGESQKPEKRNQVVLDPFGGSGSTAVAAIECGREYRLIECFKTQYDECLASVTDALKKAGRLN